MPHAVRHSRAPRAGMATTVRSSVKPVEKTRTHPNEGDSQWLGSLARVELAMNRLELSLVNVCVNLRGGNVGVPQKLLHVA